MTRNRSLLALAAALVLCAPIAAQPVGAPQTITVVDSGTACVTAPTACATYALDSSTGSLSISVSGTWTGTLTFEGSNANGVFTSLLATNLATAAQATTTTANGLFTVPNAGVITVRVRATAAMTGTATITAAKGLGFVRASGALPTAGVLTFGSPADTGLSRTAAGTVAVGNGTQGDASGVLTANTLRANANISTSTNGGFQWNGETKSAIRSSSDGIMSFENAASTIGSKLKVDALPTVASGFGTSPSVTAGSTPLAGSVNVGTGGTATTGVIAFNGTAFPSAPFCTATPTTSNVVQRVASSTTQLTLNVTTAWTASDVIFWQCISSK